MYLTFAFNFIITVSYLICLLVIFGIPRILFFIFLPKSINKKYAEWLLKTFPAQNDLRKNQKRQQ